MDSSTDQDISFGAQERPAHLIFPSFDLVAAKTRVLEDVSPDLCQTWNNRLSVSLHGLQTLCLLSQHSFGRFVCCPKTCNVVPQRCLRVKRDDLVFALCIFRNWFYNERTFIK